jgi:dCMP deaminase
MKTAEVYAELSSAKRLQVGCIIVKDNRIISIGYNGMPSGWTNECETYETEVSFPVHEDDHHLYGEYKTKPEVLHAETNAIAKVARSNESATDSTLYCTHAPCLDCAKLIYQSGVTRVFWRYKYKCDDGVNFLNVCNIECVQI